MHDVDIIRTKDHGRLHLKRAVAYFENLTGDTVRYIKPDNSAESGRSNEMKEWLSNAKIELRLPVEYAHETHGRAERAIQTNSNIAIKLMVAAKLPIGYWGFARKYAALLYNLSPNQRDGLSPVERATGNSNFDISFVFKSTFGCDAIFAIPPELRKNNKPQGKRGVYVGIDQQKLGWLVYVPREQKTYTTRNVKFYPNQFSSGKSITDKELEDFMTTESNIDVDIGLEALNVDTEIVPEDTDIREMVGNKKSMSKKLGLATAITLVNDILKTDQLEQLRLLDGIQSEKFSPPSTSTIIPSAIIVGGNNTSLIDSTDGGNTAVEIQSSIQNSVFNHQSQLAHRPDLQLD